MFPVHTLRMTPQPFYSTPHARGAPGRPALERQATTSFMVARVVENVYIPTSYPKCDGRGDSRGFQHGIWQQRGVGRFVWGAWRNTAPGIRWCFRWRVRLQ